MFPRKNKDSELIVKIAINLALHRCYRSAAKLMAEAGISTTIIERVLYDSNNIRKSDFNTSVN